VLSFLISIDSKQRIYPEVCKKLPMADTPQKKTLAELRNEAIAELERRGYDVRGKTLAQIRKMLRPHSTKWNSDAHKPLANQVSISNNRHNAAKNKWNPGE
jgi:hypothetical protein